MAEVKEAMVQGFSEALGAEMSPAELTPKEKEDAERLVRTRYGLDEHTYRY